MVCIELVIILRLMYYVVLSYSLDSFLGWHLSYIVLRYRFAIQCLSSSYLWAVRPWQILNSSSSDSLRDLSFSCSSSLLSDSDLSSLPTSNPPWYYEKKKKINNNHDLWYVLIVIVYLSGCSIDHYCTCLDKASIKLWFSVVHWRSLGGHFQAFCGLELHWTILQKICQSQGN